MVKENLIKEKKTYSTSYNKNFTKINQTIDDYKK